MTIVLICLINNGIFLSNNSGQTWTTRITADGNNAAAITTGQIDVDKIIIDKVSLLYEFSILFSSIQYIHFKLQFSVTDILR